MKQRNPYVLPAIKKKAGYHTSTNKKRGGKRGGSSVSDIIDSELQEYFEEKKNGQKQKK